MDASPVRECIECKGDGSEMKEGRSGTTVISGRGGNVSATVNPILNAFDVISCCGGDCVIEIPVELEQINNTEPQTF